MADYSTLREAIEAGETNMTVLRNHVYNDEDETRYDTGIDWFKFNNSVIDRVYSTGNAEIFLNTLTTSRRIAMGDYDAAVWDELSEVGTAGEHRFFKFRWKGTSDWHSYREGDELCQLYFDLFLFDDETIYINYYRVPTDYCETPATLGDNLDFSIIENTPCEWYWKAEDENGVTWNEPVEGRPDYDPPDPPDPPTPEPTDKPDFEYNWRPGSYRVRIETKYKYYNGQIMTIDSNVEPFDVLEEDDIYIFTADDAVQIHKNTLEPAGQINPENISEEGDINGFHYVIYDDLLCVITGSQESPHVPNNGYPWWPGNPELYPYLCIYADAHFESLDEMFKQNQNGAFQRQITFGENATFASPIRCECAFGSGGENVYQSNLECIDNISGQTIKPSTARSMFSGLSIHFKDAESAETDVELTNLAFWNHLDFSECVSFESMFAEARGAKRIDFSEHDISSVTTIAYMFRNASLQYLNFGETFSPEGTFNISQLFYGQLSNVDITDFACRVMINSASYAFRGCGLIEEIDLAAPEPVPSTIAGTWNYAFYGCSMLKKLDLTNQYLKISSNSDGPNVLNGCTNLEILKCPRYAASNITLPITMYDEDGKAYTSLPGNNIVLYKVASMAPDWFGFDHDDPITISDDSGMSVTVSSSSSPDEHTDGTKKYNVYGDDLIVANDANITYPSQYNNIPKWVIKDR